MPSQEVPSTVWAILGQKRPFFASNGAWTCSKPPTEVNGRYTPRGARVASGLFRPKPSVAGLLGRRGQVSVGVSGMPYREGLSAANLCGFGGFLGVLLEQIVGLEGTAGVFDSSTSWYSRIWRRGGGGAYPRGRGGGGDLADPPTQARPPTHTQNQNQKKDSSWEEYNFEERAKQDRPI